MSDAPDDDRPNFLDVRTYEELHRLARQIQRGSPDRLAQPTSLIHEAWERAAKWESGGQQFASRTHFVAVASRTMRRVLLDRVRANKAQKRGGERRQVTLQGLGEAPQMVDAIALSDALDALEQASPRTARVVEMRCFGGLSQPEIAEALGASVRTVASEWRSGKAFLLTQLGS